jgi:hypothetical protein
MNKRRGVMAVKDPTPELEPQFSSDEATPTPWAEACERLAAKVYLLSLTPL